MVGASAESDRLECTVGVGINLPVGRGEGERRVHRRCGGGSDRFVLFVFLGVAGVC